MVEYEHRARYLWAVGEVEPGTILDVACGTGHGSELLARVGRVHGVDRDRAAIERAVARAEGSFTVAAVPPLPFETSSFDSAVCFETIEHLDDAPGFVRELNRVLRLGGRLLISTPNKELTSPDGSPPNPFHVHEFTLGELRDLLARNGFEIEAINVQRAEPKTRIRQLARSFCWRLPLSGSIMGRLQPLAWGRVLDLDVRGAREGERAIYWILRCRLREYPVHA